MVRDKYFIVEKTKLVYLTERTRRQPHIQDWIRILLHMLCNMGPKKVYNEDIEEVKEQEHEESQNDEGDREEDEKPEEEKEMAQIEFGVPDQMEGEPIATENTIPDQPDKAESQKSEKASKCSKHS